MQNLKKFLFIPPFLISIAILFYDYKLILDKYLGVFFGDWGGLYDMGILAIILTLTSFFYCIYITFTQDIKYAFLAMLAAALIPFIYLDSALAIVLTIGFSLSLILTYFNLMTNLKSYVTFLPVNLLAGPIKTLTFVFSLCLSIGFYFYSNTIIQTQGFKIPDPIVDWAIDLSLNQSNITVKGAKYLAQAPTQEQIEMLKQNPELLEQFGLNPDNLDEFLIDESIQTPNQNAVNIIPSLPTANLKDLVKAQVSNSLDQILKPYLFAIPMILAFLFFSLASFALWLVSLLLNPLIFLVFYILEKTGFVKYEKEMREVKKLVV